MSRSDRAKWNDGCSKGAYAERRHPSVLLAPGGYLTCEERLVSNAEVIGPSNNAFRVKPGALGRLAKDLHIHLLEETIVSDPGMRLTEPRHGSLCLHDYD